MNITHTRLMGALFLGALFICGGFISINQSTVNDPDQTQAESIEGAWELTQIRGESTEAMAIRMVKILSDGNFMFAFFNDETQQFFSAGGGKYTYKDGMYTEMIEFHTITPSIIGKKVKFNAEFKNDKWYHTGTVEGEPLNEVFRRIDKGKGKEHVGAWEIFRLSNDAGKMVPQQKNLETMKLLSGTRFQWATWNSKKGDFVGTGGGTYTIEDGYYTENIEFFSPDSLRVGQSITFGCEIKGGTWHHEEYAGSRGLPINEIWVKVE
ncbi:MAG: DUF4488 domain-containing protein [Bacteroidetes bacterium]|nr:DUF4488 domain-containing protein [Bacteroidota bacterium]